VRHLGLENNLHIIEIMPSDRDELYKQLKSQSDALNITNKNAQRQYEINEWTSNNKLDTLFFYQLLLITQNIILNI
jgi:hypothetical protein